MSTEVEPYLPPQSGGERLEDYRALSAAATASVLLGLVSGLTFLSPFFAVLPLVGLVAGTCGLIQVSRRSDELTGRGLAWIGLGLSAFSLVGGLSAAAYIYATEVRPGYMRISYAELQPQEGSAGKLPPRASQLSGQKVFIKGYMFPPSKNAGIRQFLLVRDQGDCCFGGNPKITDRIEVTLPEDVRVTYHKGLYKLHGKFRVEQAGEAVDAGGAVFYHLNADSVE